MDNKSASSGDPEEKRELTERVLVSVIVVSFNTRRFLARQLAALAAQTETRWRLVLVDNASAPEERPHLHELPPGSSLLQSTRNLGFAAAINVATADLDTPFYAFLNPDAFPEPDWLERLLQAASRWPDAGAFGSTQICDENPTLLDGAGDEMAWCGFPYRSLFRKPRTRNRAEGETFSACAAAALYRAPPFHGAHGFDESFFCYNEDVDLGYRLRLRGHPTVQVADAIVRHVGGGASKKAAQNPDADADAGLRLPKSSAFGDYHGARNRLWTFVKTTPPLLLWLTAPAHALMTLLVLGVHAATGRGFASWRGVCDGVKGLPDIWRARRDVQKTRTASSIDIARAMIWSPQALVTRQPKRPQD